MTRNLPIVLPLMPGGSAVTISPALYLKSERDLPGIGVGKWDTPEETLLMARKKLHGSAEGIDTRRGKCRANVVGTYMYPFWGKKQLG